MGCAGLSLIIWIINCQCWSKKSCCLKEYHNPQNIRTFWWLCFIFFCGILACCISGILVSVNFGKKVGSAKCIYERIYYDSKFGELKNGTKWEGLENRNTLIEGLKTFVNNEHQFDINNNNYNWTKPNFICGDENVQYPPKFNEEIHKIATICKSKQSPIYNSEDSRQLIYDYNCDKESLYSEYVKNATKICKYFSDQIKNMQKYNKIEKDKDFESFREKQIKMVEDTLKKISDDLDNYQGKFLDETNYFIKISKVFGYIVVLIYYSIVIAIILFSCFCLWAYTYFKEQRIIYTLMHIAWNILKFFSFSFFLFGAAFGALYLCARDLIGYNQYIFTTNLEENTKFLPTGEAKQFLGFCMKNLSDNNYINNLNIPLIKIFSEFYNNLKSEKDTVDNYNFSLLNQSYSCYSSINRRLEDEDTTDGFQTFNISFIEAGNYLSQSINELYRILSKKERLRILQTNKPDMIVELNKLMDKIETLNCGFLKNELQILFDCLYELSIESRISCALCCCIGFFIEVAINFYLLVIYHYNNQQFKEGKDNQDQFKINQQRKFDMESQNEFMDKSKPPNLKNKNKKLDLEFSLNE